MKFPEHHLYSHLRNSHGLTSGGRNKTQPTNPDFSTITLSLTTFNIREILTRSLKFQFFQLYNQFCPLGIDGKFACFPKLVPKEKTDKVHELMVNISDGE